MASPSTQYLSFNAKISPGLASYQSPSTAELEDMKSKDPALRNTWAIWEQIQTKSDGTGNAYADSTHRVAAFSTVKGFWKYWNHLPQPSELLDGKKFVRETAESRSVVDALMVFREGVKPQWEDPLNETGGHFQFQLRPQVDKGLEKGLIDEYWNNIVLGMIGGTIDPADMITGIRLVDKLTAQKNSAIRLEVWFSNMEDSEKVDLLESNLLKCMTTRLDGSTSSSKPKCDKKPHGKK
mmetsp:Transcript_145779/g.252381  ORF Transcript_145779/g.252381 Transcript_145779/m.252381 type:complete len:238 (-) Transcript_145779:145-858(-)